MIINHKVSGDVASSSGANGLRYYDGKLQVNIGGVWKNVGGLPPRPVTNVIAKITGYKDGTNGLTTSWTKGEVYDVQVEKFNIYGYVGSEVPTSFSQFTLATSTSNESSSVESNVDQLYDYILVAPVSTDGVIQEDLSQMCKATTYSNMPLKGTTFEDMTWADVKNVADNGLVTSYFSVGDEKIMSVNGTNYKFVIADFNHDTKASGGKAPLTILLKECLSGSSVMNSSNTNTGGWKDTYMRNTHLASTIYNQLPQEVRNVICSVKKSTSAGNRSSTINTTTDTLFLLSEIEVFGSTTNSASGEGSKYSIFTDATSRIKKRNGSNAIWWLRSPNKESTIYFCAVNTDGSATDAVSSNGNAVCFGFCI